VVPLVGGATPLLFVHEVAEYKVLRGGFEDQPGHDCGPSADRRSVGRTRQAGADHGLLFSVPVLHEEHVLPVAFRKDIGDQVQNLLLRQFIEQSLRHDRCW